MESNKSLHGYLSICLRIKNTFYFTWINILPVIISVHNMHDYDDGGQKRAVDSLELKLLRAIIYHVCAGNWSWILFKNMNYF